MRPSSHKGYLQRDLVVTALLPQIRSSPVKAELQDLNNDKERGNQKFLLEVAFLCTQYVFRDDKGTKASNLIFLNLKNITTKWGFSESQVPSNHPLAVSQMTPTQHLCIPGMEQEKVWLIILPITCQTRTDGFLNSHPILLYQDNWVFSSSF